MKLVHSQNRINELMGRFVTEIRGSTAMSRTDPNKAAETILIALLNEVYGWDLKNINYAEEDNNYPGIDLADEKIGVCIQVTATRTLDKVKHTLDQFIKHGQYKKYPRLIIFTLVEKKDSSWDKTIQKIVQNRFEFDPRKAIWDYREILKEVANFPIERVLKVQKILEENFGDDRQQSTSQIEKSKQQINWREVSLKVLEVQKQESLTSYVMGAVGSRKVPDVYVPLGLVERKDKPRVGSNLDPSQSVIPEKETTVSISHNDFFDGVLKQGESPNSKGRRIAVIGEPGAGKTTLLQTIAATIDGIPIWIELSDLKQGQTLEDFLENHWLKHSLSIIREYCADLVPSLRAASDGLKEALTEVFETGQVWLLLNGVDEMAASIGQPLSWVSDQLKHGWVSQAKAVISCRLNLWSISGDRLPDFDVYRNLDFNDGEVQNFITKWFSEPDEQSSGKDLWGELKKSNDRIRELVRNPLRLTLLCLAWKQNGEKLPETKAGLYQRFVNSYYKWKADKPEFVLLLAEQEQLHQALGDLAKVALEQPDSRFRLRHGFIRQYLKPELFDQAVKLGWLVPVGLPTLDEEDDRDEDVFTFWHPTFQEYFAALAIDDWHYFFNHAVENPSQGIYKIFEVTWNEIIALWIGRKEISSQDKDDFLEALMDFEDNCDAHYWTKSFLLASTLLDEYSGTDSNSIFEIVLEWSFGFWEESIQEWKWYSDSHARENLPRNRGNEVVEYLRSCICKSKDLHIQLSAANEIARINPEIPELLDIVIQAFRLEDAKDEDNEIRFDAIELAQAIAGNRPELLNLLINQLDLLKEDFINDQQKHLLSNCIGLISPCNVRACQILINSIENCVSDRELVHVAECLLNIDGESPLAITSLLNVSTG
jgi:energy-coupling factor transporter ATP-binding protein EcfA2